MPHILLDNVSVAYPVFDMTRLRTHEELDAKQETGGRMSKSGLFGVRKVDALSNINLEINAGERVGLVGSNGAGKSTLIRAISGIYPPDKGTVEVDGDVSSLLNLGLGMRPEATGRRNIVLKGLVRGLSKKRIYELMPDIIEFSGLGNFIDLPMKTYSQGMAMRLTFSILTAFDPDVLLLDEWIGAGDADFQKKVNKRMDDLLEKSSIVILASHNIGIIEKVCSRVIHLENGEIVEDVSAESPRFLELLKYLRSQTKGLELSNETRTVLYPTGAAASGDMQGFTAIGPNGAWSVSDTAQIKFKTPNHGKKLVFEFTPFFPEPWFNESDPPEDPAKRSRQLQIVLNGICIFDELLHISALQNPNWPLKREIEIALVNDQDVDLQFYMTSIGSPSDYSDSSDKREFRVYIRSITLVSDVD